MEASENWEAVGADREQVKGDLRLKLRDVIREYTKACGIHENDAKSLQSVCLAACDSFEKEVEFHRDMEAAELRELDRRARRKEAKELKKL